MHESKRRRFAWFVVGALLVTGRVTFGAITLEETETGTATNSSSVTTSANLTSVDDHLYLAAISTKSNKSVTSVTGLGLTWVLVKAQCGGRAQTNTEVWMAQGSPTGDGTVTANISSSAYSALAVLRYSGVHAQFPIGSFESRNTLGVDGACTGGTDTSSFSWSTFDTTDDGSVVFVAAGQRHRTFTAGSGFSERVDIRTGTGGSDAGIAVEDQTFSSQTTNLTVDGTFSSTVDWGVIVVEVIEAAATEVELREFTARPEGDEVVLRWRTGFEVDHLGFHVHRETRDGRRRLTPELIAGTALQRGADRSTAVATPYQWCDRNAPDIGPLSYWLEEIDLRGRRTWHGPVSVDPPPFPSLGIDPPQPVLTISQLTGGSTQSTVRHFPALAPTPNPAGNLSQQWQIAAQPAVKIGVGQDGWIRIPRDDLVALEPALVTDPRNLRLYLEGQEQAMSVIGEKDGSFDPGDAIEFYAVAADTAWTHLRTYWLVAGSGPGMRIERITSSPVGPVVSHFVAVAEREEKLIYFASLKNGEEENFFGALVTATPVDQEFTLPSLDPSSSSARLVVKLQGVTDSPHSVIVELNGTWIGELNWVGAESEAIDFPLPANVLQVGSNVVTLRTQPLAGASTDTDISMIDFVRVTYDRALVATDDALHFSLARGTRATVEGFSTASVRIFDITDPSRVVERTHAVIAQPTGYAIEVSSPSDAARLYFALEESLTGSPETLTTPSPSRWHDPSNGARFAIITHHRFAAAAEQLRSAREAQGWSTAVIDVEDLYDEFNFGAKSPTAIRDFLRHARLSWREPPQYALLIGDATYDPRDYLGNGSGDLVPTRLIDTAILETASDLWFGDFDDDGVAEIPIGRLPVRGIAEAEAVIEKWITPPTPAGSDNALFVSDDPDVFNFETISSLIEQELPPEVQSESLFVGGLPLPEARQTLLDFFESGGTLVHFVGHGGVDAWAHEDLLTVDTVAGLAESDPLPVVISMSCLNGFFTHLQRRSLAEALLAAEGAGAQTVFAASSITRPNRQVPFDRALMQSLFASPRATFGDALRAAQQATPDPDVRRTWHLFGDPTQSLPIPAGP